MYLRLLPEAARRQIHPDFPNLAACWYAAKLYYFHGWIVRAAGTVLPPLSFPFLFFFAGQRELY
jgi:hypothetical protein